MSTPKTKPALKKSFQKTATTPAPAEQPWHYEHKPEMPKPPVSYPTYISAPNPPINHTTTYPDSTSPARTSLWLKLQALAIFLFPFVIWPWSLSPLEFSKQTFLAILVGFTLLAVLIDSWKKETINFIPRHPFLFTGLIGLILAVVSALRSGVVPLGIWGYGGTESLSLAGMALLGLWVVLVFHTGRKNSRLIINTLIASGSVLSLVAILSLLGLNIYRFIPTQGFNPVGTTTAAQFVGMTALLLAMGLWLNSQSKKSTLGYAIAMIPPVIFLLGSGFRTPLIATAVGLLVLLITQLRAGIKSTPRLTIVILGLIAATVLAIWPFTSFLQTPLEIGPSHKETWAITKQVLSADPVLGSGPASFATNYLRYRSLPILQTPFWNVSFDWGSSAMLTYLANLGFLGGGLFIVSLLSVLLWYAIKMLSNKSTAEQNVSSGSILSAGIALLIAATLSPMLFTPQFFLATILGLMLQAVARPFILNAKKSTPSLATPLFGSITILLILGLFIGQGRRALAETFVFKGVRLAQDNPVEAQRKISKAAILDRANDSYLRMLTELQIGLLNRKLNAIPANSDQQTAIQEIRTIADGALRAARSATELAPNNVSNWATLGNVYLDISPITSGAAKAAVEVFTKALELSPTDPALLVNLGIARTLESRAADNPVKQESEEAATKALTQAVEIRPNYTLAHLELARFYASLNKTDEALQSYRNAETTSPQDAALRYEIALFLLQKDYKDAARGELEAAVSISENFSNARWFLAQIYEEQNQLEKAIEQIQKIVELNPENQQAKDRLTELQKKVK